MSTKEVIISYIVFALFAKLANFLQCRDIIFDILVYNTSRKRATNKIRKTQSLKERIAMNYTRQYVKKYKKELEFWLRIKKCYFIYSCMSFFVIVIFWCASKHLALEIFIKIQVVIECIILVLLRMQFGFGGRTTKYEKERQKKQSKQKNQ